MRMITALNEDTNLVQDVTTTGEGRLCVEHSPRYHDLGQILDVTLAAYAEVLATPVDDIDWVRHVLIRAFNGVHVDENCIIRLYRRIQSGDAGAEPVDMATITGSDFSLHHYECSVVDIIPGYGAAFAIKNNGAHSAGITLSVQLLG